MDEPSIVTRSLTRIFPAPASLAAKRGFGRSETTFETPAFALALAVGVIALPFRRFVTAVSLNLQPFGFARLGHLTRTAGYETETSSVRLASAEPLQ